MKDLYLHIGMHKTGTTYIQQKFSQNRDVLLESGVEYPTCGAEYLSGHHNFARIWIPHKQFEHVNKVSITKVVKSFNDSPADKILISSESFCALQPRQIRELAGALTGFNVHVVIYIRRPCKAFYPRWQSLVKNGMMTSIQDFYAATLSDFSKFNFQILAEAWASVFGNKAVHVVAYDNLLQTDLDIAAFLLNNIMGVESSDQRLMAPSAKVNPTAPMPVPEVIRCLNRWDKHPHKKVGRKFARLYSSGELCGEVQDQLDSILREGTETLDLSPLDEASRQMEREFISKGLEVLNPYSPEQIFASLAEPDLTLRVPKSGYVENTMDIKSLFLKLTS